MKGWGFVIAYIGLTVAGCIPADGWWVPVKLIVCGPAGSFSCMAEAIVSLLNPEFAVPWRVPDIHRSIALHGIVWVVGLGFLLLFRFTEWNSWIAVGVVWVIVVPLNLFYEMAQNV